MVNEEQRRTSTLSTVVHRFVKYLGGCCQGTAGLPFLLINHCCLARKYSLQFTDLLTILLSCNSSTCFQKVVMDNIDCRLPFCNHPVFFNEFWPLESVLDSVVHRMPEALFAVVK